MILLPGLIKWCFTPLSSVFQSYHGHSSYHSYISRVWSVLGWSSEVSCTRTFSQKKLRIQCGWKPEPLDYHWAMQDSSFLAGTKHIMCNDVYSLPWVCTLLLAWPEYCRRFAFAYSLTLSLTSPDCSVSAVQVFWKHRGKRRDYLCNKHFLLFRQCFLPIWRILRHFHWNFLPVFFHPLENFCNFHQIHNCCLQIL